MCLVTEYFMALTGDYYICACGIASSKLLIAQFNTRETSTMRCNGYWYSVPQRPDLRDQEQGDFSEITFYKDLS